MKISAITITKNEEKNIEKSINSYRDIADEIIIVDTGSTDRTKEICNDLGCKVIDYVWEDDFSKARNFAISQAKYDCILFLDADEYFVNKLDNNFKISMEEILSQGYNGIKFATKNIDTNLQVLISNSYGLKFFKNIGFKYERKIHELISSKGVDLNFITVLGYDLVHTGYSVNTDKNKCKRNLDILNKLYESKQYETIDLFYMLRENLSLGEYETADNFCDEFFSAVDYKDIIEKSDIAYLSYFYKYYIMKNLPDKYNKTDLEQQLNVIKYELQDVPQTYYELGLFEKDYDYEKALSYFKRSIKENIEFENKHQRTNNFNNFEPHMYYLMSEIEYILGHKNESLSHSIVACMLDRHNSDFLGLLLKNVKNKKIVKIIDTLDKIYQPKTTSDYEFLINSLVNTQLYGVFVEYSIRYNLDHNGGSSIVFIAMILNTQIELCINTTLDIYKEKGNEYNLFLATLAIMYSNDEEMYYKYRNNISELYKNILDYYFGKSVQISDIEFDKYIDLYIRLMYLTDKQRYEQDVDMSKISNEQLLKIINCQECIGNYYLVYDIISKNIDKVCFESIKDILVEKLLFSLFITRKYKLFIKYYNKYCDGTRYTNMLQVATKGA